MSQRVIIFDSPDGTGKTNIARELSRRIAVPYFKMTTEHENWRRGTFIDALRFDQTYITEFLKQTGCSAVFDRAFPAEFAYSKVFNRETDHDVLRKVDEAFAALGTLVIIPLRRDYHGSRPDEVVAESFLPLLHSAYLEFAEWTRCKVILLYVDDFENDLRLQVPAIYAAWDLVDRGAKVAIAGKE